MVQPFDRICWPTYKEDKLVFVAGSAYYIYVFQHKAEIGHDDFSVLEAWDFNESHRHLKEIPAVDIVVDLQRILNSYHVILIDYFLPLSDTVISVIDCDDSSTICSSVHRYKVRINNRVFYRQLHSANKDIIRKFV